MLKIIETKIATRDWSEEEIGKYVGQHKRTYFSFAADKEIRDGAASRGSVTCRRFCHLQETDLVQGVLAVRTTIEEGLPKPQFFVATTKQDLLDA